MRSVIASLASLSLAWALVLVPAASALEVVDGALSCGMAPPQLPYGCLESASSADEELPQFLSPGPPRTPDSNAPPLWQQLTYSFESLCVLGEDEGNPCETDSDCMNGTCVPTVDRQTTICVGGTEPEGTLCTAHSDCTSGGTCGIRVCEGGGFDGNPCVTGAECTGGSCVVWDQDYDTDPTFVGEVAPSLGCFPDSCGIAPETIFGDDDRERVTATKNYPWRTVGELSIKFPKSVSGSCSGAVISKRVILTAGHCLHIWLCDGGSDDGDTCSEDADCDGDCEGYWGKSAKFRAGRNASKKPYGTQQAEKFGIFRGWVDDRDVNFDMGLVLVDKDIGNKTGWMGRSGGGSDDGKIRNHAGYPGDKKNHTQWFDHDPVESSSDYRIFYKIDAFQGQSGGPVWRYNSDNDERHIRAVMTSESTNNNRGVLFAKGKFKAVSDWIEDNESSTSTSSEPCTSLGCTGTISVPDCNENGVPDAIDISSLSSADTNSNGFPDECEQACCVLPNCSDEQTPLACVSAGGIAAGTGTVCTGDGSGSGLDDTCDAFATSLPTAAPWSQIALGGLLLMIAGWWIRRESKAGSRTPA